MSSNLIYVLHSLLNPSFLRSGQVKVARAQPCPFHCKDFPGPSLSVPPSISHKLCRAISLPGTRCNHLRLTARERLSSAYNWRRSGMQLTSPSEPLMSASNLREAAKQQHSSIFLLPMRLDISAGPPSSLLLHPKIDVTSQHYCGARSGVHLGHTERPGFGFPLV